MNAAIADPRPPTPPPPSALSYFVAAWLVRCRQRIYCVLAHTPSGLRGGHAIGTGAPRGIDSLSSCRARACFTCCTLPQRRRVRVGLDDHSPARRAYFAGAFAFSLFDIVTIYASGQQSKRRNHRRKIVNRSENHRSEFAEGGKGRGPKKGDGKGETEHNSRR